MCKFTKAGYIISKLHMQIKQKNFPLHGKNLHLLLYLHSLILPLEYGQQAT